MNRVPVSKAAAVFLVAAFCSAPAVTLPAESGAPLDEDESSRADSAVDSAPTPDSAPTQWPSFRGYRARGVVEGPPAPRDWDTERGRNVLWKTAIAGLGLSSPIVWNDRVYVTTAVASTGDDHLKAGLYGDIWPAKDDREYQWKLLCLDARSGTPRWERVATSGRPKVKRHPKSSHANSTPVTDGERVVAFFGSEGLYCYSADGELQWKRDFGVLDSGFFAVPAAQWGFASSPVIHGNFVVIQCDVQKDGFVAALDLKTGDTVWRTPRSDVPTWSTPCIHSHSGGTQVILNGYKHIGAYDLKDGREVWKLAGGGDIPVPTPIVGHGLVYITNAHGKLRPIYAIQADAQGELQADGEQQSQAIQWYYPRRGSYMQTPLLVGDLLFACSDRGVLGCYDAKKGQTHFQQRLGSGISGFTASLVASGDVLYATAEGGDVFLIRAQKTFAQLPAQSIGETILATPALAGGRIYFRGRRHLICVGIAEKP